MLPFTHNYYDSQYFAVKVKGERKMLLKFSEYTVFRANLNGTGFQSTALFFHSTALHFYPTALFFQSTALQKSGTIRRLAVRFAAKKSNHTTRRRDVRYKKI
jgi:hypothetical protein